MLKFLFMVMFLALSCHFFDNILIFMSIGMIFLLAMMNYPQSDYGLINGSFYLDKLGYCLMMLSLIISMLGLLSSWGNLQKGYKGSLMRILIVLMLFLLILSFVVNDLMMFYLYFEASLIPLIVVVVGYGIQPEKLEAGLYMLFYTIFGSLPLLIGLLLILDTNYSLCYVYLGSVFVELGSLMFPLLMGGFMIKLPIYLVHLWLPKAHVEAPVYGSMILAGVMLKLGGYGVMRLLPFLYKSMLGYSGIIVSFSVVGGVLASLICLCQNDLKCLVAYSSVGHMMMFMGGLFSFSIYGWIGGILMMVAHGLTSSGMFSLINMLYERVHTRSMVMLRGLVTVSPALSMFWFLLSASNMAAPPFLNLLGELTLAFSIVGLDMMNGVFLGLMFFFGAAYSMYIYSLTQHGWVSSVLAFYSYLSLRESLVLVLHLYPLLFLVLKLDLMV